MSDAHAQVHYLGAGMDHHPRGAGDLPRARLPRPYFDEVSSCGPAFLSINAPLYKQTKVVLCCRTGSCYIFICDLNMVLNVIQFF